MLPLPLSFVAVAFLLSSRRDLLLSLSLPLSCLFVPIIRRSLNQPKHRKSPPSPQPTPRLASNPSPQETRHGPPRLPQIRQCCRGDRRHPSQPPGSTAFPRQAPRIPQHDLP